MVIACANAKTGRTPQRGVRARARARAQAPARARAGVPGRKLSPPSPAPLAAGPTFHEACGGLTAALAGMSVHVPWAIGSWKLMGAVRARPAGPGNAPALVLCRRRKPEAGVAGGIGLCHCLAATPPTDPLALPRGFVHMHCCLLVRHAHVGTNRPSHLLTAPLDTPLRAALRRNPAMMASAENSAMLQVILPSCACPELPTGSNGRQLSLGQT